jgi:predicted lipoprotein with Yx(FWY)xxD motif
MINARNPIRTLTLALLAIGVTAVLAACGSNSSSSDSSSSDTTSSAQASSSDTVSEQSVSGVGAVLVDAQGQVLYTNDKDTAGSVACSGECAAVWIPLTLPAGTSSPSGPSDLTSKLGVVTNPDGDQQVTLDGKPLYTFAEDGPGEATGDGVTDSFGGTSFSWSVATGAAGSTAAGGAETTTSTDSSSSGGGYGY